MTPEAQKWRQHFARSEQEQLLLFPPLEPQTPLDLEQWDVALAFLRHAFPFGKRPKQSGFLGALRADEPTRAAFYQHFGMDNKGNIFCFPNHAWKAVTERFASAPKIDRAFSFSRHWHEFSPCARMEEGAIKSAFKRDPPEEHALQTLFFRDCGAVYGPLAAQWRRELWHWDGRKLLQLPEYGLLMQA